MIETVKTMFDGFVHWAKPADGCKEIRIGDFVELGEDAPEEAKESYRKYISLISRHLLSNDDLIIENLRIVGIAETATGKSREQLEIVMRLIADGWIDNDPFIKVRGNKE
jgi:hypothetical protein